VCRGLWIVVFLTARVSVGDLLSLFEGLFWVLSCGRGKQESLFCCVCSQFL
jgi:hypothetical protein